MKHRVGALDIRLIYLVLCLVGSEHDFKGLLPNSAFRDKLDWVVRKIVPYPAKVVQGFDQAWWHDSSQLPNLLGQISKQLDLVAERYGRHRVSFQYKLVE